MFGFLKHRGFAIKIVGLFHTAIISLFISFRVAKHVQSSSSSPNIVTLVLGFISLALLALYYWSRNLKIEKLGIYGATRCALRFKLGLNFSICSWVIFMVVNLLSIFLDQSGGNFVWYSYIGLVASFMFSCLAMSFFSRLEKRLI